MGQYFSNDKLPSDIQKYHTKIYGKEFIFSTDNGVFSKEKLDYGTRFLLETIPINKFYGNILDIGCGYGPIGITVGKLTNCFVDMCDVNKRAIHLAEINARDNKVDNVRIFESDTWSNIDKKYDVIITNPPIRAGKKVVYDIVMNAKDHLEKNGNLYIVIRKEQGAKSMIKDLEKYYQVEVLEKNKGFFIINAKTIDLLTELW
ncbi:MAG: methyltransferase [Bacilli bacterium]|nr:methyltransferase [Bacilli bacterium]